MKTKTHSFKIYTAVHWKVCKAANIDPCIWAKNIS